MTSPWIRLPSGVMYVLAFDLYVALIVLVQGKELIMELDSHDLRLLDADSQAVLHTQPIHQIRVWGVGRDNTR